MSKGSHGAAGDVRSTLTFAELSVTLSQALQALVATHETEVAWLQGQLNDALAQAQRGLPSENDEDGHSPVCQDGDPAEDESVASSCEAPALACTGPNAMPSRKPELLEVEDEGLCPCGPGKDMLRPGSVVLAPTPSFSSDESEVPVPGTQNAPRRQQTRMFRLPEEGSEVSVEDDEEWHTKGRRTNSLSTCTTASRRLGMKSNKASLSSLKIAHDDQEDFLRSRVFRHITRRQAQILRMARKVLRSAYFELLMCVIIILDWILVGLSVNSSITGSLATQDLIYGLGCFLTGIFAVELIAKVVLFETSWSWDFVHNHRVELFETAVTLVCGVLVMWILVPSGLSYHSFSPSGKFMQLLICGRFLRLARFYRVGVHISFFRDIFVFLRGISGSAITFAWAVVLLIFFTFVFGIIGVIFISSPLKDLLETTTNPEDAVLLQNMVDNYLGTLPLVMYTLSKILTGQITCSTFLIDIDRFLGWSWIFWQSYLALMELLIMNLITAALVDNAIGYQQAEAAERREELAAEEASRRMEELREMFVLMDENGDGTLSWLEIKNGMMKEEIRRRWLKLNIKPEEAKNCFCLLDRSGKGEVGIEEFFTGLQRMQGLAQSQDLFQNMMVLQELRQSLRALHRTLARTTAELEQEEDGLRNLPILSESESVKSTRSCTRTRTS